MDEAESRAAAWARQAVRRKWPGVTVEGFVPLAGDASTRRFWRVSLGGRSRRVPVSVVCVDLGADVLPRYAKALNLYPRAMAEPPWINVHRFLAALEVPVPALYDWSPRDRLVLIEDVRGSSLFDAARADPDHSADLFRDAVRELLRIHVDATARADSRCVAFEVAYDERLFAWELEEFTRYGLEAVAPGADPVKLEGELSVLARRLGALPRVFSHRDFHAGNLFVQSDSGMVRIRIIDFQDALMAPGAQDLAVLLTTRDTSDLISARVENKILEFYYAGLLRRSASKLTIEEFVQSYRLCVLQHALKCMGRFPYLERQGKSGYARYLRCALAQARRMLAEMGGNFPMLRAALNR